MRAIRPSWPGFTSPLRMRTALRSAVIIVAFALVAIAVFTPQFAPKVDGFCDNHKVGCSLVTGFVSTGIVILTGYFVLFVWTLRRSLRTYTEIARTNPERLMPTAPPVRADAVVGRTQLLRTVANEALFSRAGDPILLVGEAGSGKTTLLLALAQRLARRDLIPVVVSLRGATPPLSFRKLAEQEFIRRIDPVVRAESDAQRVWRQLCADGRIVVLADALDDVGVGMARHERDHVIRTALSEARGERLAVIATARPETVPFATPTAQFEVGPLDERDALAYLRARVALPAKADDGALRDVVATGQIAQTPLYLNVVSALLRAQEPLPQAFGRSKDSLIVELLDAWAELIGRRALLPQVELDEQQRRRVLEGLSAAAYAMTLDASADMRSSVLEQRLGSLASSNPAAEIQTAALIEGAGRLELLDTFTLGDDLAVRFKHTIMQSYFAARFVRRNPAAARDLLGRAGPESLAAVAIWASAAPDGRAEEAAAALLDRAAFLDHDSALAFALTAHDIAGESAPALAARAAGAAEQAWEQATPRGRLAAVRTLDGRGSRWSHEFLFRATRDASYRVRWTAATAIAAGGSAALAALEHEFAAIVRTATDTPVTEWSDAATHDISVLCWIAPALAASVDEPAQHIVEGHARRLAALVPNGMPLGTEASLAQGFKLAALHGPTEWADTCAGELLARASFWYARITFLHALCVSACERRGGERGAAVAAIRARLADDEEHPFVRETARLCLQAVREDEWRRYVWQDESALIAQSASALADEAARLLGDIVLLLNLTEQGPTKDAVEERKARTYLRRELPYCLATSRDRSEQIFGACHADCGFGLCPYPATAEHVIARGEFSQAFCEHQIELVSRRRRRRRVAGWTTSRASRRRFWERMRARVL